jgi:hypothetical protein
MVDPARNPSPSPGDNQRERESKIEELLLAGLDHYFSGEYQEAINVWTRVLFFERGHTRACAYIERARSADAERHRRSEELISRGVDAFNRGESGTARQMLTTAIEESGADDVAVAMLDRLSRLDLQTGGSGQLHQRATKQPAPVFRGRDAASPGRPVRWWPLWAWGILLLAVLVSVVSRDLLHPVVDRRPAEQGRALSAQDSASKVPTPRRAELALERARRLSSAGRLRDALETLEAVKPGDPLFGEAERLRADIQRALLGRAAPTGSPLSRSETGPFSPGGTGTSGS